MRVEICFTLECLMPCLIHADVGPRRSVSYCLTGCLIIMLLIAASGAAYAASPPAPSVLGRITDDARPVSDAIVSLKNDKTDLTTKTNAKGMFRFAEVPVGSYRLHASKGNLAAEKPLDVPASGLTDVELEVEPVPPTHSPSSTTQATPREIGRVGTPATGSGTSVSFTGTQLGRNTAGESFTNLLLQVPAATRGANGQIDINGQRNGVGFVVDGVPVPPSLSRNLGADIDADDLAGFGISEGAYPASVGDTFGAVVNVQTTPPNGPPHLGFGINGGDYGYVQPEVSYHFPLGTRGGVALAAHASHDDWTLDPPASHAAHDAGSVSNQLVRASVPIGRTDLLDVTASGSRETYQTPGLAGYLGVPDDTETQADAIVSVRYRHLLGSTGAFSFGPTYDRGTIVDGNDPAADLSAFSSALPSSDCGTVGCIGSAAAVRSSTAVGFAADYANRFGHHHFASGVSYRATSVQNSYDVTLGPRTSSLTAATDRIAHSGALYIQDSWQLGNYVLDYGMRQDAFTLSGVDANEGFAQTSPRIKVTRSFSPRANLYVYYGRLFAAPPADDLAYRATPYARFDLHPQRDSLYEMGAHAPLGSLDLGIRIAHKTSEAVLDDVQLGTTNIREDVNFTRGITDVQALLLRRNAPSGRDLLFSIARTRAVLRGCPNVTFLTCPARNDWFTADYAEPWTAALTQQVPTKGGYLSGTMLYGSGRGDESCVACHTSAHLTFDALVARRVASALVTLTIQNVFNDRYLLSIGESDGIHYNHPRSVRLVVSVGG